jgi:hypothetical protein
MNQTQLKLYFENVADGNNRRSQCKTILKLFKQNDVVLTQQLRMFAYQYNARIYQLRRGLYDGKKYLIEKCKDELDRCGFKLLGWCE